MASNRIQTLTPVQLENLSASLLAATSGEFATKYGVSSLQTSALQSASQALSQASDSVLEAKAAYHSAVQARDAAAQTTANAAASMARSIYAHPGITPELIAAAGLSPRSTSKARVVPTAPVGLVALPQQNGDVLLTWSKLGNAPSGVTYVVEAKVGSGEWGFILNSNRARLRLESYAASGMMVSFRVSASKNGQVSAPSAPATIYAGSSAPVALKLAA